MNKKQIYFLLILMFLSSLLIAIFFYNQGVEDNQTISQTDIPIIEPVAESKTHDEVSERNNKSIESDIDDEIQDDDDASELDSGRLFPLRENIEPYTEELPPTPNKTDNFATLHGVDSNNNYVRDDVEIAIVEKFEDDKDLVEAFFSAVRSSYWDDTIILNEQFDEATLEKVTHNISMDVSCESHFYYTSKYSSTGKWYTDSSKIGKQLRNTRERKQISYKLGTATRHITGKSINVDTQMCLEHFQSTKTNPYQL